MFPRWLWLNHVPAGLNLTAEQYAQVSRHVRTMGPGQRRLAPLSRRMLVRLVPATIVLSLLFTMWLLWLIRARPGGAGWMVSLNILGILAFQALIWIAIAWSINRAIAPLVWRALNQIGVRVCEGCGYVLEYHPSDAATCPECGQAMAAMAAPDTPPGNRASSKPPA